MTLLFVQDAALTAGITRVAHIHPSWRPHAHGSAFSPAPPRPRPRSRTRYLFAVVVRRSLLLICRPVTNQPKEQQNANHRSNDDTRDGASIHVARASRLLLCWRCCYRHGSLAPEDACCHLRESHGDRLSIKAHHFVRSHSAKLSGGLVCALLFDRAPDPLGIICK